MRLVQPTDFRCSIFWKKINQHYFYRRNIFFLLKWTLSVLKWTFFPLKWTFLSLKWTLLTRKWTLLGLKWTLYTRKWTPLNLKWTLSADHLTQTHPARSLPRQGLLLQAKNQLAASLQSSGHLAWSFPFDTRSRWSIGGVPGSFGQT